MLRKASAFRQSSCGWKIAAPDNVTVGEIVKLIARQLKVCASYILLSVEGNELPRERTVNEGAALSMEVDRSREGNEQEDEASYEAVTPSLASIPSSIAIRVHQKHLQPRTQTSSPATTRQYPAQMGGQAASSTTPRPVTPGRSRSVRRRPATCSLPNHGVEGAEKLMAISKQESKAIT